jgi:hypothetical protein
MSICRLLYHGIFILTCLNMLCAMSVLARLRLCAHTLKVEAAAWLGSGSSCVYDQCPGEDEQIHHVQTVHAFSFCQDSQICELGKHFSIFFLHLFSRTFQQPNLFCCNRSTTTLIIISFLSRALDLFFIFLRQLMDLFVAGRDQSAADQPNSLAEGHPPS